MSGTSGERRIRGSMLLLVGVLTVISFGAACLYCLFTWSQPNRGLMLTLYGVGVGLGAYLVLLARRLAAATRVRRLVMVTLTLVSVVIISIGAYLDGGADAPTVLGFFAPMVFVAITARPRLQVYLQAIMIVAYLAVAAAGEPPRPGYMFLHTTAVLVVVVVCAAQARLLARQRAELRAIALLDPLTGALNRRGLGDVPVAPPTSVICLDFDGFKLVNDTLGHAAGDELLCWAVTAMRRVLRQGDAVARLGGDEFVIVLPGADASVAAALAERVVAALAERIEASAGTATGPGDGATLEALLTRADQRLYDIKRQRRREAERVA